MKRKRLFILIYAMLICVASVGCSTSGNISETETSFKTEIENEVETQTKSEPKIEIQTESETIVTPQTIKKPIIVKYSEKEIVVFSNTTCFFDLYVSVRDGEFTSQNTYGEFQISEGETITLTLEDLAPNFFSDTAIIEDASCYTSYVYGDSPLSTEKYKEIDCTLLIKCSSKEIIVYSDTTCFFDLCLSTEDDVFKSINTYSNLSISEGETITLTLNDLAPNFFSDNTVITSYSPLATRKYIKK